MKNETKEWLKFSEDNLLSAKILVQNFLYNPCLQNIQQTVEKALKSIIIEKSIRFIKTHSLTELKNYLQSNSIFIEISDEECDFLDTIYIPSKYPLGGVLPDYNPDNEICQIYIQVAERILDSVKYFLNND